MSLLRELNKLGVLRTFDDALANTLRRLDPGTPDDVLAAAALASMAVANGHAAFDPASPRQLVDADIAWPDAEAWRQQLAASRVVATPHSPVDEAEAAPLVLENGLLYLRRYREYERRLALQLQRIASQSMPGTGIEPIAPLFDRLFPE
ncbi:MAG: exodeoxyribonuclease V subunit alpha, partial [Thermomonas sp.]|nr:exodeoxyribonuclease V subunit alpha [Thermomonas sp.]